MRIQKMRMTRTTMLTVNIIRIKVVFYWGGERKSRYITIIKNVF